MRGLTRRHEAHYIGGFLIGFIGYNNLAVMGAGNAIFVAYQVKQDFDNEWKRRPDSHKDLLEWAVGLIAGICTRFGLLQVGINFMGV